MTDPTLPPDPLPPEIVRARPASIPGARPIWRRRSAARLELPTVPRGAAAIDLVTVVVVSVVVTFGFPLAAMVWLRLTGGLESSELEEVDIRVLIAHKWFELAVAAALMTLFALRHRLAPASFGLRTDHFGRQLLWAIGSLGTTYAWMLATIIGIGMLVLLYPALQEDLMVRTETLKFLPVHDVGRTILLLIPVAAHEEVVFRGLLLPYLRRLTGHWWAAILISSAIFALLHFNQGWLGVVQILGVGTGFAVFFVLSRSLIAVIIAHFVFDFIQFQLARLLL